MKIAPLLALSFLLAGGATLSAQQAPSPAKESPPDPPLLGTAPAECQWTITYTPKTPEKEAVTPLEIGTRTVRRFYNPTVLSKRVLKSNGQMVIYTNHEAGIKSEAWVLNGVLYELPFRAGQSISADTRKASDFSEIDWVNADHFRGTVELKGTKVHLYESDGPGPAASPSPADAVPATPPAKPILRRAYIDAVTRLPVMVDLGNTVLTYQYAGPAAAFPVPDERIKKIMRVSTVSR